MASLTQFATLPLPNYSSHAKHLLSVAQRIADEKQHMLVEPIHVLSAFLLQSPNVNDVLERSGVPSSSLQAKTESALIALPKLSSGLAYFSQNLLDLLTRAEREFRNENLTQSSSPKIEASHLLNAITQELKGSCAKVLEECGIFPGSLRVYANLVNQTQEHMQDATEPVSLSSCLRPLSTLASRNELPLLVEREKELSRTQDILARASKHHLLLVGERGVGKTALVYGLAAIYANVYELDAYAFCAGAKTKSELESRFSLLLKEISTLSQASRVSSPENSDKNLPKQSELVSAPEPPLVLFVPHFFAFYTHQNALFWFTEILAGALQTNGLRFVLEATPEWFEKYKDKDPRLSTSLSVLYLGAPNLLESEQIISKASDRLARYHDVTIDTKAVSKSVLYASKYISDRSLPDSAFDLLDEACAHAKTKELNDKSLKKSVTEEDVALVLERRTGVLASKLLEDESEKLKHLETQLSQRVLGQNQPISALSRAIRRARTGFKEAHKPIGSFLFLGPSGVGKTELAKTLAETLFETEQAMIRLDMSEFIERHMVQRLLGSPPGYADSDKGGFLTEAVRQKPYSVLLFDEIEKAHPDVFNILLQVLDDGRLTDARGRTVSFAHTIVIMTSNVGGKTLLSAAKDAFLVPEKREQLNKTMQEELLKFLRPELLNRMDEILLFEPLQKETLIQMVHLQLKRIERMLSEKNIKLSLSEEAILFLINEAYNPMFGARPLKRSITLHIQDPLSDRALAYPEEKNIHLHFDHKDRGLVLTQTSL